MVGDEKKRSKISRANGVPPGTAQVGLVGCASGHSALFPDKRAHSRGTRICAMSRILFLGCASGHTASWPGWPANGFWTVPPYIPQKWPVGPGWPELKLGLVGKSFPVFSSAIQANIRPLRGLLWHASATGTQVSGSKKSGTSLLSPHPIV